MPSPQEVVTYRELRQRFGLLYSREHLARLSKAGKFPKSIRLSYRCIAWRVTEIEAWLQDRAAARDEAAA